MLRIPPTHRFCLFWAPIQGHSAGPQNVSLLCSTTHRLAHPFYWILIRSAEIKSECSQKPRHRSASKLDAPYEYQPIQVSAAAIRSLPSSITASNKRETEAEFKKWITTPAAGLAEVWFLRRIKRWAYFCVQEFRLAA